jgi:hypothetical protein
MKAKFSKLALIAAIGLAAAGTSYAHEDTSEAGANHWVSHASERPSTPTANQLAPFGYAATKSVDREVSLPSGSKYLNVTRLETSRSMSVARVLSGPSIRSAQRPFRSPRSYREPTASPFM